MSRNKREGRYFGYMGKRHSRIHGGYTLKGRAQRTKDIFDWMDEVMIWSNQEPFG